MGVDWERCWADVAAVLSQHITAGRQHLLTEEAVRFALVGILEAQGVAPRRIAFEHRVPGIGPIDLVIDAANHPMGAAVEIKFPRDPKEKNSADTMTVGELLNDFSVSPVSRPTRRGRFRSSVRGSLNISPAGPIAPGSSLLAHRSG